MESAFQFTASQCAVFRNFHPDNQAMALDGRGKSKIAPTLDAEEHHGSLFWVVGRTSQDEDVNLVLENVTFDMQIKMSLPLPKKRKTWTFSWDSSMMPVVPILVNKKKIMENIQLLVSARQEEGECS